MSNTDGTIRAIGEGVLTITRGDTLTRGDGTSAAAPLVTAAIALMLQANDRLTVAQIKTNLGIGTGAAPKLNAFAAVQRSAART